MSSSIKEMKRAMARAVGPPIDCQSVKQSTDCAVQVRKKDDDDFDYVRDTCERKLNDALRAYNYETHFNIECYSAGTDQAMEALKAGLSKWAGGMDIKFTGKDGFVIQTNGGGMRPVIPGDKATDVEGDLDMGVPERVIL